MGLSRDKFADLQDLIRQLDFERVWLLEQIDKGRWAELRIDLAALEREMGQVLTRAAEKIEQDKNVD